MSLEIQDKFESKLVKLFCSCWIWIGPMFQNGYGEATKGIAGSRKRAHRLAWEISRGVIPDGLSVLHRCDVKCCVSPEHLYLGTALDNARDAVERGQNFKASRTRCEMGYPLYGNNLRIYRGKRICIFCQRSRTNLWWSIHGVSYRASRRRG